MQLQEALQSALVDPRSDPLWRRLVEGPESDVFHSPAWLRVLADTYDLEMQASVVLDGEGEPVAGLPFCRIDDMLGPRVVALPFSDYCDPLAGDLEQWLRLSRPLLAGPCPVTLRCLHNDVPLGDGRFALAKQARWHAVDLGRELDAIWASLHESSRRAIRKARQAGVGVRVAETAADLRAFYEMHLRTRKQKYRMIAQPYRFFEQIWQQFMAAGRGHILLATDGGAIIGATMFLEWRDKLYYKFNTSAPEGLAQRPNDLLLWEGIVYGKAKGCRLLDLGLSDWDQEGLIRFKRKFATEEGAIRFLRHTPAGFADSREAKMRALLGRMTGLLTDAGVPDGVTGQAGDLLYRYFS